MSDPEGPVPAWGELPFDRFIMDRRDLATDTSITVRDRLARLAREFIALGFQRRIRYNLPAFDKEPWSITDADAAAVIGPLRSAAERACACRILKEDLVIVRVSYADNDQWETLMDPDEAENITCDAFRVEFPDFLDKKNDWNASLDIFPELADAWRSNAAREVDAGNLEEEKPRQLAELGRQLAQRWAENEAKPELGGPPNEESGVGHYPEWNFWDVHCEFVSAIFFVATQDTLEEPSEDVLVVFLDVFGHRIRECQVKIWLADEFVAMASNGNYWETIFMSGKIGAGYRGGKVPNVFLRA